jgi:hypothetical protein
VLILGNRQGKSFKGVKLFELVVGLIVGGTAGVAGTWFALKNTVERALAAKNVDYKDRWQEAVKLLGSEGNLTDEQVQRITGEEALHLEPGAAENLRRQFQDMYSEDRRDAEIARAEAGLPPLDDLSGMYSEDIRDVMKARVKHGTG